MLTATNLSEAANNVNGINTSDNSAAELVDVTSPVGPLSCAGDVRSATCTHTNSGAELRYELRVGCFNVKLNNHYSSDHDLLDICAVSEHRIHNFNLQHRNTKINS